jgi:hypothetical protein
MSGIRIDTAVGTTKSNGIVTNSALICAADLTVVDDRGREYPHWLYFLPHALFTRRASNAVSWFSRRFAVSSIFLCRSSS